MKNFKETMKDRGKATAIETTYSEKHKISDFNYSISSDMPCIKHPNSSPIGICSFCLKDKLLNLICSDQFDNERNSCSVEMGSVGRISFLLENEKHSKTEQVILLRSSSNSVEIKKNRNGFWKIKRLFKKNREKGDDKSEVLGPVAGGGGVSRSRSLCSFRGGDDGNSDYRFSSAKISDVTGGLMFDYADHDHVVESRKSESGGDFKNMRKKFPNSESVCCSDSPNMLPILQKRTTFRGSDMHSAIFLKSPSNINSDGGLIFPVKESDFGNTMDYDCDFKNLRKKFPNSESLCCSNSPNILPILQKHTTLKGFNTHPATFLKSPSNVNSEKGIFFPIKESDFGNNMDDDGDFKNLRKKFPNSDSVCLSDSPNMLSHSCQVLQKRTTSHSTSFLKGPSNVNSERGVFFPGKESDFGNTMDDEGDFKNLRKKFPISDSVCYSDSPNMLSNSYQILKKRTTSHSTTFLKSPSNTNSKRGIFFPVKESDFGNNMDDDGDFKNLRKKFPNSDSVCFSDSSNMLSHSCQVLQKRTTSYSTTFLKSPSNTNSERGTSFPVKGSDFGNTMDDDDDDDSAFIDLKLDLLSSSSTSLSEPKLQLFSDAANLRGGSCRMNEYDTRMKEGNNGKGKKVWKWISRKKTTTSKRDEINSNLIIKS